MSRRLTSAVLLLLLFFLGIAASSQDQSPRSRIRGTLKDPSGAVIQAGRVELKNLDSGLTRLTLTDEEGRYTFDSLPAGHYQVSGLSAGFETAIRRDITVEAGEEVIVDLVMTVLGKETVMVVTASQLSGPLVVETDPRAPRQPIPAHDGADYLKTIPGFSIIRKGGSDGDPVFRGMSGSRLSILIDGEQIFGGCGGRMDPPTAYVFPAAYDRITVVKGPESVRYGPDVSAGAVLFERDLRRVETTRVQLHTSLTVGSFGRHDEMIDARVLMRRGYVQAIGTRSHTNDYRDGNHLPVHSLYTRWSGNAAFGWTPGEQTRLELSMAQSDGRAAYADRAMDGVRFARDNIGLRFERRRLASWIDAIEAQSYYNYIDHVMDNYSLRVPGTAFSTNNPDRRTTGGRVAATLHVGSPTTMILGGDTRHSVHRTRSVMGKTSAELAAAAYLALPRLEDMRFSQSGFFTEATRIMTLNSRLVGGFRVDRHESVDSRMCVATTMCPGASPLKNNTQGAVDRRTLMNGFGRFELDVHGESGTLFAGVGHAERFPDYWERLKQDPNTLKSAFLSTRPEKITQLDTGLLWRSKAWHGSASAFYGKVQDYILIRWKPAPVVTRNVDVATMGFEADLARRLTENLGADVTLAYVRSDNNTDHTPLAQQPPIEGRVGLNYRGERFSLGGLARIVGRQDRVAIGFGNIVVNGMDLGPTGGFCVFSINGGYLFRQMFMLSGGIDNLLDRTYAEHISQAGVMIPDFVQTTRVNEPGRTLWLKVDFGID
jgi:iron complex outermembrane receptor protein